MEGVDIGSTAGGRFMLPPRRIHSEDILFCIDVDAESLVEMKSTTANGRPLTRLEAIKQAILLFVNCKLSMNPDHRFAFATLAKTASWLRKEFSSEVESAIAAVKDLQPTTPCGLADLTHLFKLAAHEAKKSRAQNRILRVVLIYCRSSVRPQHQWPVNQKLFTFDVMYLHNKPGPDNCPQAVYDALTDTLELVTEYEGYILESGQGSARVLLRQMCLLLSHPEQRCAQEDLNVPKALVKKSPAADSSEEVVPVSSQ